MKKVLAISVAVTLSLSAMSALAGNLTMQSNNEPNQINVLCGPTPSTEKDTGMPIPANGQRILPYIVIKSVLGSPLSCDFYEAGTNTHIASANLTINGFNSATITSYTPYSASQFSINISAPVNQPAANITVSLTKL